MDNLDFKRNVGNTDRLIRLGLGAVFLALGLGVLRVGTLWGALSTLFGGAQLVESATGY